MEQKWYQSWGLWLSMAALIAYIAKTVFRLDIADWLDGLMSYLLPVLVAFGIVNNPNTKGRLGYTREVVIDLPTKEGDGDAVK